MHEIIDDTLWKMKAIYNPIKRFAVQFIPGYDPSRGHETTPFNMNYREYRQCELYFLLNDIFGSHMKLKLNSLFPALCTRGLIFSYALLARTVK